MCRIQASWRSSVARSRLRFLVDKIHAAMDLQRLWRGVSLRRKLPKIRKERELVKFSVPSIANVQKVRDVVGAARAAEC